MQSAVTAAINSIGSSITLTEYTEDTSDGGYTAEGEETASTVSETAIPYAELKTIIKGKFGNLETGSANVALKYTANISLTTKYKITWEGEVYDLTKIDKFTIQDTLVAYIISMSKRQG